ncbi:MAG: serine protein kinase RIO, partial [Thermoplasmata archaeon]|nr:serine protein kinase RIO [Thermoplasmata archaeon]
MPIDGKKYRLLEVKIDALKARDKDSDRRKTYDEVFDDSTLLTLYKLFSDKVIDIVEYPVATGKEGNVFKGKTLDKKNVAVKIYRTSTSSFKHMSKYMAGDVRFSRI